MINLNKKMSLALKLMTLAVMMNIATGCESCKKDDKDNKDGNKKVELGVSFDPKNITEPTLLSILKINNTAKEGEFNPEDSGCKVSIEATVYASDDTKITDLSLLKTITYEVGGEKGNSGVQSTFALKAILKEKLASTKEKEFNFEIKGLDKAKHNKAEFKVTLKDKDGKDINHDTLTWKKA